MRTPKVCISGLKPASRKSGRASTNLASPVAIADRLTPSAARNRNGSANGHGSVNGHRIQPLNDASPVLIGGIVAVTLAALALFWRALVADCLDPLFLRSVSRMGGPAHFVFLGLVVLNLVGGFQALGTLLSVGLMILPAAAARFWTERVETMCALSVAIGFAACVAGLLLSYHLSLPSGPAIILSAGVVYFCSILFGTRGVLRARIVHHRHRTA